MQWNGDSKKKKGAKLNDDKDIRKIIIMLLAFFSSEFHYNPFFVRVFVRMNRKNTFEIKGLISK